jgi:hypothetical protein
MATKAPDNDTEQRRIGNDSNRRSSDQQQQHQQ